MRLKDALSYFGTQQKLANALQIAQGSISSWKPELIPMARALQIERLTDGKLKADLSLYVITKRHRGPKKQIRQSAQ